MKVLETAVGAVFARTRFSLVSISIRDLVADRKSLVRSSGDGGGGRIMKKQREEHFSKTNVQLDVQFNQESRIDP